ncbi:MAG: VOC family protein [Erysipelotrichaceae bacterium]|nr:VOC family protein [Erysipelotrichaceae bacterium]
MIKEIGVYFVTNGNGLEAVEFYKEKLNAEVKSLTLFGDFMPECPDEYKKLVMNAQLYVDGIRIQLSDENPEFEYKGGTNMAATIIAKDVETAKKYYQNLTEDCQKIFMELQEVPWSPAYAGFVDKFGMMWQINVEI